MEVKIHKLWKHIGTTIHIKDSTDEYIPNGMYLVLGKDSWGHIEIGNLMTRETTLIEEYDEDDEVTMVDHQVNIEELTEFKLATCVQLVADGWSVGGGMDLKPFVQDFISCELLRRVKDK